MKKNKVKNIEEALEKVKKRKTAAEKTVIEAKKTIEIEEIEI